MRPRYTPTSHQQLHTKAQTCDLKSPHMRLGEAATSAISAQGDRVGTRKHANADGCVHVCMRLCLRVCGTNIWRSMSTVEQASKRWNKTNISQQQRLLRQQRCCCGPESPSKAMPCKLCISCSRLSGPHPTASALSMLIHTHCVIPHHLLLLEQQPHTALLSRQQNMAAVALLPTCHVAWHSALSQAQTTKAVSAANGA
mgnify:CR=1 FL=1